MAILSPITGTSMPEGTDPPAGHSQMTSLVGNLERYVVGRFATTGARDAAIPAPTDGMIAVVVNKIFIRLSGAWVSLAGAYSSGAPVGIATLGTAYIASTASITLPAGNWLLMAKCEAAFSLGTTNAGATMQIYNSTGAAGLDVCEMFVVAAGPWRFGLSTMASLVTTVAATVVNVRGLGSQATGLSLAQIRLQAISASSIN